MTSPEFELAMVHTEYDAAIKSLVVASKLAARYQGERDAARAALVRVEARCEDAEDQRRWLTAFEIRDAMKEPK